MTVHYVLWSHVLWTNQDNNDDGDDDDDDDDDDDEISKLTETCHRRSNMPATSIICRLSTDVDIALTNLQ